MTPDTQPEKISNTTGRRTKSDYHKGMDTAALAQSISNHLKYTLAKHPEGATLHDQYWSAACAIRDRLVDRWISTQKTYHDRDSKRAYYLSMEYLPGRSLRNSIINLDLAESFTEAMKQLGFSATELFEVEPDAGLGNGGLGRLASCLLDSLATLQIPAMGYGLRYEFGMFRQSVHNGAQVEDPDYWLRLGTPCEINRPEATFPIKMFGNVTWGAFPDGRPRREWTNTQELWAVPADVPVPGYGNNTVNILRLWQAHGTASLQDILRRYRRNHSNFDALPDKIAIQINDTHPAVAVAELMRLLIDVEGLEWEKAWAITQGVFGYTNHTLMPEALEKWSVELFGRVLPRHLEIVYDINFRFLQTVVAKYPGDVERMRRMSIIEEGRDKWVRMAHLAVVGSHSVNGVSALHGRLLRERLFPDFDQMYPGRFNSKTNGITPRRWLLSCNPGLASLIAQRIGTDWPANLDQLRRLAPLAEDSAFRASWRAVKLRRSPACTDGHFRRQGGARLRAGEAHHPADQRRGGRREQGPRSGGAASRHLPRELRGVARRGDHSGRGSFRADLDRGHGSLRHRKHEVRAQRGPHDRHPRRRQHRDEGGSRGRQHLHLRPHRGGCGAGPGTRLRPDAGDPGESRPGAGPQDDRRRDVQPRRAEPFPADPGFADVP